MKRSFMVLSARSLSGRLLLAAAVAIVATLLLAGTLIGFGLEHFVRRQVDERLDTQIAFLASTVHATPEGRLRLDGNADGPPFDRPGQGWYWQINGPVDSLRARSLGRDALVPPVVLLPDPPPPGPPPSGPPPPRASASPGEPADPPPHPPPRGADGPGPGGRALHYRIRTILADDVPVQIVATAPRAAIVEPLQQALLVLGLSLAALGIALIAAMAVQVRLGLQPLARLREAVAEVRAGRRERVPADQPEEVRPLVTELNALLGENAANLERARRHVANLAHGLKTPLATLALALSRDPRVDPALGELVEVMERRIRHHLGRARAAALGGPARAVTDAASRIEALAAVLAKVNVDRGIAFAADVPDGMAVACEQQDFDEIAGNLLENAFKWARGTVMVRARREAGPRLELVIDDDGPGVAPEQIATMLQPGQRLDESEPGFGFGLAITRELVELYGGRLDFGRAPQGGLRVTVSLPMAT